MGKQSPKSSKSVDKPGPDRTNLEPDQSGWTSLTSTTRQGRQHPSRDPRRSRVNVTRSVDIQKQQTAYRRLCILRSKQACHCVPNGTGCAKGGTMKVTFK